MRSFDERLEWTINGASYALAAGVTVSMFALVTGKSIGMDTLLSFLLAQMMGVLLLYYQRLLCRKLFGARFTSDDYAVFTAVNTGLLVAGVVALYILVSVDATRALLIHVVFTAVFLVANAFLQAAQTYSLPWRAWFTAALGRIRRLTGTGRGRRGRSE